jgi:small subunit ribosomal protein S17
MSHLTVGTVTSVKMAKTAVVEVARSRPHPLYRKAIRRTKKFHVHDPLGVSVGDVVEFVQTRPLSRTKRWIILRVVVRSPEAVPENQEPLPIKRKVVSQPKKRVATAKEPAGKRSAGSRKK